eukprot:g60891.t1
MMFTICENGKRSGYGLISLDDTGKLDIYATLHFMLHTEHSGVREFLAHRLYDLPDVDIDFVLPQLCNLVIKWPAADAKMLEKFLVHTCSVSVHLALKVIMQLEAIAAYGNPEASLRLESLVQRCETAVVNSAVLTNEHREAIFARVANGEAAQAAAASKAAQARSGKENGEGKDDPSHTIRAQLKRHSGDEGGEVSRSSSADLTSPKLLDSEYDLLLSKQIRSEYFNLELQLMSALSQIADALVHLPREKRKEPLHKYMRHLNKEYIHGLYFPLSDTEKPHYKILSVLAEESVALSSRDKAPYMMWLEIAPSGFRSGHPNIYYAFQDIQDLKRGYQSARKTRFKPYPMWETWSEVHSILLPELEERVRKLASSERIFLEPCERPKNSSEMLVNFDLDLFYPLAMLAVKSDHLLAGMRDRLVPSRVSEELFWRNYVTHVDRVRNDLAVPSVLTHLPKKPQNQNQRPPNTMGRARRTSRPASREQSPNKPSSDRPTSPGQATEPASQPVRLSSAPAHCSAVKTAPSPGKHTHDFPDAPWSPTADDETLSLNNKDNSNDSNNNSSSTAKSSPSSSPTEKDKPDKRSASASPTSKSPRSMTARKKASSARRAPTPRKAKGQLERAKTSIEGGSNEGRPVAHSASAQDLSQLEENENEELSQWSHAHGDSRLNSSVVDEVKARHGPTNLPSPRLKSSANGADSSPQKTPRKGSGPRREGEPGRRPHTPGKVLKESQSEPSIHLLQGGAHLLIPNVYAGKTPFGELYKDRRRRIASTSKYSSHDKWDLTSVIFKGGDDCRQEVLAMQLIELFDLIWRQAHIPLRLRPYGVLVTSATSGIIETVLNATSVDSLKKGIPNFESLHKFFEDYFAADPNVKRISDTSYEQARRHFIESMAAYSVVTYLLQVRDRHNGNIMIVEDGSIVHIDFGFMLSNSPGGNMNFESCAFKLTDEYVEVMSTEFHYFQLLVVRGFLEARRHAHKFITLVEVMHNSSMACFLAGDAAIAALRQRFFLELSEKQCVEKMMEFIEDSVNNWRSVQYDNYQRITNGIL